MVQNIKKSNGKVILSFRDEASRDKAEELINKNKDQQLFDSVFVPKKIFPLIVRLHDVENLQLFKGEDLKCDREKQECALMQRLMKDNPGLAGHLVSARLLFNRPNTNSFLVRLGVSSKSLHDFLLDKGRLLLDNKSHAVVEADPNKEIKHCSSCQKYGHLKKFCKSQTVICGKCSSCHDTQSCTVSAPDLKCPNCSLAHSDSAPNCPARRKAVAQYLKYMSSD